MSDIFASALTIKLKSHDDFWKDYGQLLVEGFRLSLDLNVVAPNPSFHDALIEKLSKLLYCASIFCQTQDEGSRYIAQSIALSALLCTEDHNIRSRSTSILADIGNFPGVDYVNRTYPVTPAPFVSNLRLDLLRVLNSVPVGDNEIALTDFQLDVWSALPSHKVTSISAPTSAGKSFLIIEYLCQQAISSSVYTAVYIAPTRALLAEVHRRISERLIENSNIRVSTVPSLDTEDRLKQIFVLTQERLHVLLAIADINADLIVIDEAQNIADGPRGMILHDCIERLYRRNPAARLLLLSPGAEGFNDVARLLGIDSIDIKETSLSPVLQTRIKVMPVPGKPQELTLALLGPKTTIEIGTVITKRGVADPATRLAAVALELGSHGGSLVYATGPTDAERVSEQLTADQAKKTNSPKLDDLSAFIKEHIHRDYGLAEMVTHGISFHYGRMPTLLREALERAFSDGDLQYMVCTTTLFQGVNLPARSVFIDTPTRGRGVSLDTAHLWNFAGRAGRLGKDLVGNVFLVDYDNWSEQKLNTRTTYSINPSLSNTVEKHFESVIEAVSGGLEPATKAIKETERDVRAAAGLMLARAVSSRSSDLLSRLTALSDNQRSRMEKTASASAIGLGLPASVVEGNWAVDLYGLKRLAETMRRKVLAGSVEDLIPVHPRDSIAYKRYTGIYGRIARDILGYKPTTTGRYGGFIATYAIPWMDGRSYPELLRKWIDFQKIKRPRASINDHVRTGFEFFEDVLRFQMVQLGKAYIDVLHHVLTDTGLEARRGEIFDYALALELGISSTSGRAFVELGTSRIAAVALEALFPDSELTPGEARKLLAQLNIKAINLSPIIVTELKALKLID